MDAQKISTNIFPTTHLQTFSVILRTPPQLQSFAQFTVVKFFPPLSSRWCTRLSLPPGEKLEGRCDTTGGTLLGWCEGCAIPEDTPEHQGFNQSMKQKESIVSVLHQKRRYLVKYILPVYHGGRARGQRCRKDSREAAGSDKAGWINILNIHVVGQWKKGRPPKFKQLIIWF